MTSFVGIDDARSKLAGFSRGRTVEENRAVLLHPPGLQAHQRRRPAAPLLSADEQLSAAYLGSTP